MTTISLKIFSPVPNQKNSFGKQISLLYFFFLVRSVGSRSIFTSSKFLNYYQSSKLTEHKYKKITFRYLHPMQATRGLSQLRMLDRRLSMMLWLGCL